MVFKRKTIVSDKILSIFKEKKGPFTISQINEILTESNIRPNTSTIYRILDKLKSKNIISELFLKNGVSYYELTHEGHKHHHFFCTECEIITCLDHCLFDQFDLNLDTYLPNDQFKISTHEFNLYGTCNKCSTKTASADSANE